MAESTTLKMPSPDSLRTFHEDISLALSALQKANPDVAISVVCGSALQLMLNFPHQWMTDSGTVELFVDTITQQSLQFVELKAKADASLG